MASLAPVLGSALAQQAKPVISGIADKATSGILGGAGKLIGGKKGAKVGKAIAKGLSSVRRHLLGFSDGGKVRINPVRPSPYRSAVIGYSVGGAVKKRKPRKSKK